MLVKAGIRHGMDHCVVDHLDLVPINVYLVHHDMIPKFLYIYICSKWVQLLYMCIELFLEFVLYNDILQKNYKKYGIIATYLNSNLALIRIRTQT